MPLKEGVQIAPFQTIFCVAVILLSCTILLSFAAAWMLFIGVDSYQSSGKSPLSSKTEIKSGYATGPNTSPPIRVTSSSRREVYFDGTLSPITSSPRRKRSITQWAKRTFGKKGRKKFWELCKEKPKEWWLKLKHLFDLRRLWRKLSGMKGKGGGARQQQQLTDVEDRLHKLEKQMEHEHLEKPPTPEQDDEAAATPSGDEPAVENPEEPAPAVEPSPPPASTVNDAMVGAIGDVVDAKVGSKMKEVVGLMSALAKRFKHKDLKKLAPELAAHRVNKALRYHRTKRLKSPTVLSATEYSSSDTNTDSDTDSPSPRLLPHRRGHRLLEYHPRSRAQSRWGRGTRAHD